MVSITNILRNTMRTFAVGIGGSSVIYYLASPYAADITRTIYEIYYSWVHGIPSFFSLEYWFSFLPLRGHVSSYAYNYAAIFFASACACALYAWTAVIKPLLQGEVAENAIISALPEESQALEPEKDPGLVCEQKQVHVEGKRVKILLCRPRDKSKEKVAFQLQEPSQNQQLEKQADSAPII